MHIIMNLRLIDCTCLLAYLPAYLPICLSICLSTRVASQGAAAAGQVINPPPLPAHASLPRQVAWHKYMNPHDDILLNLRREYDLGWAGQ